MASIKSIARRNSKLPTDLDNFRGKYREIDRDLDISVIFPACEIYTYEKNLFYLISKSKKIPFNSRWEMRPDYVSSEFYSTVIYWPIILFVNKVFNIEDFRSFDFILIPSYTSIIDITKDRVPFSEIDGDIKYDSGINYDSHIKYPSEIDYDDLIFISDKFNKVKTQELKPNIDLNMTASQTTDTYTLNIKNINDKYIILSKIPLNTSSILFSIEDYNTTQKYSFDYILKQDDAGFHRKISWANIDCQFGNGLEAILEVGHTIKITYTYGVLDHDHDYKYYKKSEIDQSLENKMDKVPSAENGNIASFNTEGSVEDSGIPFDDISFENIDVFDGGVF